MTALDDRGLLEAAVDDGRPLIILMAIVLAGCGVFGIFQAATHQLLPHDEAYLGMTARELCAVDACRVLDFMIHDRVSFGGVLVAVGVLYLWIALFPLGRESWAWWTLVASGTAGFLTFLAYVGYGYLDTWHAAATLMLLPMFAAGAARTRALRVDRVKPIVPDLRTISDLGRGFLLLASLGITLAGMTILIVGMTRVFVPQDLEFIGATGQAIHAINPHLVPLIAHDRAGFGGALLSFGIAMFGCLRYARPSRALFQALTVSGFVGFGATLGVHGAVGYMSATHLGPAVLGCAVFAVGLMLAAHDVSADVSGR